MKRTPIAWMCFLLTFACSSDSSYAQGIVDCVYPGRVAVSHARGQIFDPFGGVLPGGVVTLANERGAILQTTTDNQGRFSLATLPGNYAFKAVLPMFESSQTRLNIGEDLTGLIHRRDLRVVLGLSGSYCAWTTTSKKEFQQIINGNKRRSEEAAQRNATQK